MIALLLGPAAAATTWHLPDDALGVNLLPLASGDTVEFGNGYDLSLVDGAGVTLSVDVTLLGVGVQPAVLPQIAVDNATVTIDNVELGGVGSITITNGDIKDFGIYGLKSSINLEDVLCVAISGACVIGDNSEFDIENLTAAGTQAGTAVVWFREGTHGVIRSSTFSDHGRVPIRLDGSTLEVEGSTFERNSGLLAGGIEANSSTVTVTDGHFEGLASSKAGAIWVENGSLTITSSRLIDVSGFRGGAISVVSSGLSASLVVDDCTIQNATALDSGGAIYGEFADVVVEETVISSSVAYANALNGGGLWIDGGSLTMTDTTLTQLQATLVGGGLGAVGAVVVLDDVEGTELSSVDGGFGWIISGSFEATDLALSDCSAALGAGLAMLGAFPVAISGVFTGNRAALADVLHIAQVPEAQIHDSAFCGNDGGYGAIVAFQGTAASESAIERVIFSGNTGSGASVQIRDVVQTIPLVVSHVTAWSESTPAVVAVDAGDLQVLDSLFVGPAAASVGTTGAANVTASWNLFWDSAVVGSNVASDNEVHADPLLSLAVAGDCESSFAPDEGSPAIDGGDPTHVDPDGTRADLGAVVGGGTLGESTPTSTVSGEPCDADGDGFLNADCGGDDCDDASAAVYPGAEGGDGGDVDCDGFSTVFALLGGGCGCQSTGAASLGWAFVFFGLRRRRP